MIPPCHAAPSPTWPHRTLPDLATPNPTGPHLTTMPLDDSTLPYLARPCHSLPSQAVSYHSTPCLVNSEKGRPPQSAHIPYPITWKRPYFGLQSQNPTCWPHVSKAVAMSSRLTRSERYDTVTVQVQCSKYGRVRITVLP